MWPSSQPSLHLVVFREYHFEIFSYNNPTSALCSACVLSSKILSYLQYYHFKYSPLEPPIIFGETFSYCTRKPVYFATISMFCLSFSQRFFHFKVTQWWNSLQLEFCEILWNSLQMEFCDWLYKQFILWICGCPWMIYCIDYYDCNYLFLLLYIVVLLYCFIVCSFVVVVWLLGVCFVMLYLYILFLFCNSCLYVFVCV